MLPQPELHEMLEGRLKVTDGEKKAAARKALCSCQTRAKPRQQATDVLFRRPLEYLDVKKKKA